MKNKSIGFCFAAVTCVLAIVTLILLLVYASRGGVVQPAVYIALVADILC